MCRRQPRMVGCSPNTVKAAVASLWAAEVRPGCNGVAGGCAQAADPEAVAAVSADAGDGESWSGSARRTDSLIEFVKTTDLGKLQCLTRSCVDAEDGLPRFCWPAQLRELAPAVVPLQASVSVCLGIRRMTLREHWRKGPAGRTSRTRQPGTAHTIRMASRYSRPAWLCR